MNGLTKNDSDVIAFVLYCYVNNSIDRAELRAWGRKIIESTEDYPSYIQELIEFSGTSFQIYKVVGFMPAMNLSLNARKTIAQLALYRKKIISDNLSPQDIARKDWIEPATVLRFNKVFESIIEPVKVSCKPMDNQRQFNIKNSYELIPMGEYEMTLTGYNGLTVQTYRIINFEKEYDSASLFNTLLKHHWYSYSYLMPRFLNFISDVHGPFIISKMSSDNFIPITKSDFTQRIDEISRSEVQFDLNNPVDIAHQKEMWWLIDSLSKNDLDYYELEIKRKDERYIHDWAWVLTIFHEFVLIDRTSQKLILFVISED